MGKIRENLGTRGESGNIMGNQGKVKGEPPFPHSPLGRIWELGNWGYWGFGVCGNFGIWGNGDGVFRDLEILDNVTEHLGI